jgi:hypothetical protein
MSDLNHLAGQIRLGAAFDYDNGPTILALRKIFSQGFDAGVSASAEDNAYFVQSFEQASDELIAFVKRTKAFVAGNPGTSGLSRAKGFNAMLADTVARLSGILGYVLASGAAAKRQTSE